MGIEAWIPIVVIIAGGGGYLFKRWLENRREAETADNAHRWVRLYRDMHDRPPTVDDLLKMKATFMTKHQPGQHEADKSETISIPPSEAPEWMFFGYELTEWEKQQARLGKGIWTQLELNEQASRASRLIDQELVRAINQLNESLTGPEIGRFEDSIKEWKQYRDAQATYAASKYEGGTVAPMFYWGEYFDLTKAKLDSVTSDLRFRASQREETDRIMKEFADELDRNKPS